MIDTFITETAPDGPFGIIIGYPVSQSLSPVMHNLAARHHGLDFRYHRLEVRPGQLPKLRQVFDHPNFVGANVTVPHKIDIADIVDELSDEALVIGAVNTIAKKNGRIAGYNTDFHGFAKPLEVFQERLQGRNAMIFGSGGATRAIVYALNQLGMETIWLVARQPHTVNKNDFFASKNIKTVSYRRWTTEADDVELIVNATPLGMFPDVDTAPIEEHEKDALIGKIVYDIVYKPMETKLLRMARQVMADTVDGVDMLVNQGAKAFELWTGKPFPTDAVSRRVRDVLNGKV